MEQRKQFDERGQKSTYLERKQVANGWKLLGNIGGKQRQVGPVVMLTLHVMPEINVVS